MEQRKENSTYIEIEQNDDSFSIKTYNKNLSREYKRIISCNRIKKMIIQNKSDIVIITIKCNKIRNEIIKFIIKLKNYCDKLKIYFHIENTENNNELNSILHAILIKEKREKYEYIYDEICEYLDNKFRESNYCDFQNDKCIANREGKSKQSIMGCCYSFEYKWLGYSNHNLCKYIKDKKCTEKCITCKLFTCKYLREKGIKFDIKEIPLIRIFLNKKQQEIIRCSFFRTKEEIIDKLLEPNKVPYYFYMLFELYRI